MAKASVIIKQLISVLPRYTGLFSDDLTITSLTRSGSTVTAVTSAAHGLTMGNYVTITGAVAPVVVTQLTYASQVDPFGNTIYTASGLVDTDTPHDLTLNPLEAVVPTILITGATPSVYNGTALTLTAVPNRFEFSYRLPSNPGGNATGTILLFDNKERGYNGVKQVTVVNATTFTYSIDQEPYTPALGTITGRTGYRISGAVSIERAIEAYTVQPTNKLWGFVVKEGADSSKDRRVENDGTYSYMPGMEYRQRIVQKMAFYVFIPTTAEIAALNSADLMEDLALYLFKAMLGFSPTSLLSDQTPFGITFAGHDFYAYSEAYYIHKFNFEILEDITTNDIVPPALNVAFRDIELTIDNNPNEPIELGVNLDDQPYAA